MYKVSETEAGWKSRGRVLKKNAKPSSYHNGVPFYLKGQTKKAPTNAS